MSAVLLDFWSVQAPALQLLVQIQIPDIALPQLYVHALLTR